MLFASVLMILFFFLILGVVTVTVSKNVSGAVTGNRTTSVSDADGFIASPVSVPAAQPATLTTRSSGTAGSLTMTNSSHGITTGQRVDLYWTGGQCYGALVGTVSGTTVPIASVSGGSSLPSASTAITVGIVTSVACPITGNNMSALVLSSTVTGYIVFNTGSADAYAALMDGSGVQTWTSADLGTNPLTGSAITTVYFSHNNTTAAQTSMQSFVVTH